MKGIGTEIQIGNTFIDLYADQPINLNFQVADLRDPTKRNYSFSKTIKIPGSKTNNELFSFWFEPAATTITTIENFNPRFNPFLKAKCTIYQDSIVQMQGFVKLEQLNKKGYEIEYELTVIGSLSNFFGELGDKKITSLDWSSSDHLWNRTAQTQSWTATTLDYVYPLTDLGLNPTADTFDVTNMYPAVYCNSILRKSASELGYSIQSNFLDSDFAKSLIIPYTGEKITLSTTDIDSRKYRVSLTGDTIEKQQTMSRKSFEFNPYRSKSKYSTLEQIPIIYNDEQNEPNSDINNLYELGTFTVPKDGTYNFTLNLTSACQILFDSSVTQDEIFYQKKQLTLLVFSTGYGNGGIFYPIEVESKKKEINSIFTNTFSFTTPNAQLKAGEKVFVYAYSYCEVSVETRIYSNLSPVFKTWIYSGATIFNNIISAPFFNGTMQLGSVLPQNLTIADVWKAYYTMFNLMFSIDKNDDKKLILEPASEFFSGTTILDWSEKLVTDKEITSITASDVKQFNFQYKQDDDFFNSKYSRKYNENYGDKKLIIPNDFAQAKKDFVIPFAATPSVKASTSDLVIPKIYQVDELTQLIKPKVGKPRILQYGGLKTGMWNYTVLGDLVQSQTTYPYAGMLDDPYTPTYSLDFEEPIEIYWKGGGIQQNYTNNNLYNRFYKSIEEVIDPSSKLITCYLRLSVIDIYNLDFRNVIQLDIDGNACNYRLNKVIDYDPTSNKPTKVELQKIKSSGVIFSAGTVTLIPEPEELTIIEGGYNEVRNLFSTSPYAYLDGGLDCVRALSATTNIFYVDGGLD
jgi:hypothetical protein